MKNQLYPLPFISLFFALTFPFLLSAQCISGNCTTGQGTFLYPSGAKYTGDFVNSRSHGQGICYYTNNSKYQGSWKNGYPEGSGKKILTNGEEWIGEWRKGQPYDQDGSKVQLTKVTTNNNQYKAPDLLTAKVAGEGCVEGNCYNGQGTYIYQGHSARYIGSFRNEMPHGYGTIVYASGDQYDGNWANGSFDGQGILHLGNGDEIAGVWANGRHVQNATTNTNINTTHSNTDKQPSNVWAVIVGVSSYNHMPTLKFTDDDAYRMYAFLKSPEGGALADDHLQILIDEDATRNKVLGALEDVFLKAGRNDLVLLYFSGHGLQGSFLPSDFDGFNNKILHEEINSIFQRSQAKYKLCIADACHSGSLVTTKGTTTSENLVTKYYETLAQSSPGTALILSSKSNETSLESSGLRQGVFSHFLIRGLKGEADGNHDKIVTIQELFDYTDYNVRTYTGSRQSPVIKGNYDRNMPAAVVR